MNKGQIIVLSSVVIITLALIIMPKLFRDNSASVALDEFALCLADKEVTMYGAEWCSRCADQKKMFGNSFRLVPYIECPDNPQVCIAAGVSGYPTWIFPDGRKFPGVMKLEDLSRESGCPLPEVSS